MHLLKSSLIKNLLNFTSGQVLLARAARRRQLLLLAMRAAKFLIVLMVALVGYHYFMV